MKKEAPVFAKAKSKTNSLKAKKIVLKGICSHKKKIHTLPMTLWLQRQHRYPWQGATSRNKLSHYAVIKFLWPLSLPWRRWKMTVCFLVSSIKANSTRLISLWRSSMTLVSPTKINTQIQPDGEWNMFNWQLVRILGILPTKLESSRLNPTG